MSLGSISNSANNSLPSNPVPSSSAQTASRATTSVPPIKDIDESAPVNPNPAPVTGVQSVPAPMAGSEVSNQGAAFSPILPSGSYSLSPFGSYSVPGEIVHTENITPNGTKSYAQNNSITNSTNNNFPNNVQYNNSAGAPPNTQNQNGNVQNLNQQQSASTRQIEYREYTTMEGDNLLSIAGHELGDSLRWSEIRDINPEAVSKLSEGNPTFPIGTKLYLPPYDKSEN